MHLRFTGIEPENEASEEEEKHRHHDGDRHHELQRALQALIGHRGPPGAERLRNEDRGRNAERERHHVTHGSEVRDDLVRGHDVGTEARDEDRHQGEA